MDKATQFPAWYDRILVEADVMDKRYPVKGMPIFTTYGYHMHCQIMEILEREWSKQKIDKVQFPILIPKEFFEKEADHVAGFTPEVFWVTKGGEKELEAPAALRPTSETAMYSMFSIWVRSFRDLPLKIHQTCTVYRYETKDTMPLIRAREIHWNEAHTCHATEAEALENLEAAWRSYLYLINDCLGVFGVRIRRPEWDKFAGATHTDVLDCVLPSGKVLQCVGAHYLGQGFAKAFNIKFLNDKNEFEHGYMTCYGVSTRLLACCLSTHGDNKGLVLPSKISKYQVVIVPIIMKKGAEEIKAAAHALGAKLREAGVGVVVDDAEKKPGEKYYYWEMKGVPLRIEVGPRDLENNAFMLVRRANGAKQTYPQADVVKTVQTALEEQDTHLREQAKKFHNDHVTTCMTMDEAVQAIQTKGGFVRIPFFSTGVDGKEGDKIVHAKTGGEVRGFVPSETIESGLTCAATGKPATCWAYVARSY